jgi:hypothetical protein
MTFPELMSAIRASYAENLARELAGHDPARREAAMRRAGGELALDGTPALPHRFDVLDAGGDSRMVDAERQLKFDSFTFDIDGMSVSIAPFTWDWLGLGIDGDAVVASNTCAQWFLRWFDAEDAQQPGADGLHGVVHFMGDPAATASGIDLRIDLGSAPDEAIDDLLFSLAEAGIAAVRLRA